LIEECYKKQRRDIFLCIKRKENVKSTHGDISKAKRLLGWEPKITIKEGVRDFVTWYKKHYAKRVGAVS
jgi:UDP-glucose 4-epimerase